MATLTMDRVPEMTSMPQQPHTCTNCERPAALEGRASSPGSGMYSCPTCGQREEVSWHLSSLWGSVDIHVIQEANVILGDL